MNDNLAGGYKFIDDNVLRKHCKTKIKKDKIFINLSFHAKYPNIIISIFS